MCTYPHSNHVICMYPHSVNISCECPHIINISFASILTASIYHVYVSLGSPPIVCKHYGMIETIIMKPGTSTICTKKTVEMDEVWCYRPLVICREKPKLSVRNPNNTVHPVENTFSLASNESIVANGTHFFGHFGWNGNKGIHLKIIYWKFPFFVQMVSGRGLTQTSAYCFFLWIIYQTRKGCLWGYPWHRCGKWRGHWWCINCGWTMFFTMWVQVPFCFFI